MSQYNSLKRGFKKWAEDEAENLRKNLGVPIVSKIDMFDVASHLGVPTMKIKEVPDMLNEIVKVLTSSGREQFSAVTLKGKSGKTGIIYNESHSLIRTQSNLSHELSHILCGHIEQRESLTSKPNLPILFREYDKTKEDEASWLSGCLLLPRCALISCLKNGKTKDDICDEYCISPQMYQFRLNVSGARRIFKNNY